MSKVDSLFAALSSVAVVDDFLTKHKDVVVKFSDALCSFEDVLGDVVEAVENVADSLGDDDSAYAPDEYPSRERMCYDLYYHFMETRGSGLNWEKTHITNGIDEESIRKVWDCNCRW